MTSREFKYVRGHRFKLIGFGNHVFKFSKPGCPICGQPLLAHCEQWYQDKWGWAPAEMKIECSAEPDIDDEDEWDDFFKWHYSTPYIDWLPLEIKISEWAIRHVRFTSLQHKQLPLKLERA